MFYELRQILLRLKKETVANLDGYVLTNKGKRIKSVRNVFEKAIERAGIAPRITRRSFRTSTITAWESLGIARAACLIASGHKPSGVHEEQYIQLSDAQLIDCFARVSLMAPAEKRVPNEYQIGEAAALRPATA